MNPKEKDIRFARRQAEPLSGVIRLTLAQSGLYRGMNEQLVRSAWGAVTGLQRYTQDLFVNQGTLFVTLSSSAVRSQLRFRQEEILRRVNEQVLQDPLYVGAPGEDPVKKLVLK